MIQKELVALFSMSPYFIKSSSGHVWRISGHLTCNKILRRTLKIVGFIWLCPLMWYREPKTKNDRPTYVHTFGGGVPTSHINIQKLDVLGGRAGYNMEELRRSMGSFSPLYKTFDLTPIWSTLPTKNYSMARGKGWKKDVERARLAWLSQTHAHPPFYLVINMNVSVYYCGLLGWIQALFP